MYPPFSACIFFFSCLCISNLVHGIDGLWDWRLERLTWLCFHTVWYDNTPNITSISKHNNMRQPRKENKIVVMANYRRIVAFNMCLHMLVLCSIYNQCTEYIWPCTHLYIKVKAILMRYLYVWSPNAKLTSKWSRLSSLDFFVLVFSSIYKFT